MLGLRSRCTTPAPWMAVRAAAIPTASPSRSVADSRPLAAIARSSRTPSTYSVTRYGRSPERSASSTLAVQNPTTRRAAATSCRNIRRNDGSPASSGRSTLTATRAPSPARARNTVPIPPAPSRPTTW